jgi:hypothetical protein
VHAASLNSVATLPIAVVNTRMQTADRAHRLGLSATVAEIMRTEGLAGLWRGIGPSLILSFNPAITFLVFERLKGTPERDRQTDTHTHTHTHTHVRGRAGAGGGLCTLYVCVCVCVCVPSVLVRVLKAWGSMVGGAGAAAGPEGAAHHLSVLPHRRRGQDVRHRDHVPIHHGQGTRACRRPPMPRRALTGCTRTQTRMQWRATEESEAVRYRNSIDAMRKVFLASGVAGLYQVCPETTANAHARAHTHTCKSTYTQA